MTYQHQLYGWDLDECGKPAINLPLRYSSEHQKGDDLGDDLVVCQFATSIFERNISVDNDPIDV